MALIKLQDTPLHEVQVPFQKPYLLKVIVKICMPSTDGLTKIISGQNLIM